MGDLERFWDSCCLVHTTPTIRFAHPLLANWEESGIAEEPILGSGSPWDSSSGCAVGFQLAWFADWSELVPQSRV